MQIALLLQKAPEVKVWIQNTLLAHAARSRPVSALRFPRLADYFPAAVLDETRVVTLPGRLPVPPLGRLGLSGFADFENLEAAGITYYSTYFVRADRERDESLHFHELVHAVQWRHLGFDRFLIAYGFGHLVSGSYESNPMEEMAYRLQSRFERHEPRFDVEAAVAEEVDALLVRLMPKVGLT